MEKIKPTTPKVSVIVPVYGVERYIERCARSLFEQTLDDIEYLFIDDCTLDSSIEILKKVIKEYPERDSQIIIHKMEKNSGQAAVRKWGILNSSGKYVIHCDSDDWIDIGLYKKLYEKAVEQNADIVVCDLVLSNGQKNIKIERGMKSKKSFLSDMMYSKVSWSLCNKLIKRRLYDLNISFPRKNVGEDMAICLQVSAKAKIVSSITGNFYYYFINPSSTMNDANKEKTIRRYIEMCSNVNIVNDFFKIQNVPFDVSYRLNAIKLYAKCLLLPAIDEYSRRVWENQYPEIGIWTFFDPSVRFRYKAIYILYKFGLYNYLKKLR